MYIYIPCLYTRFEGHTSTETTIVPECWNSAGTAQLQITAFPQPTPGIIASTCSSKFIFPTDGIAGLSLWNNVCLLSSSESPEVTKDTGRTWKSMLQIDDLSSVPRDSVPKVRVAYLRWLWRASQKLHEPCGGLVWASAAKEDKQRAQGLFWEKYRPNIL